MKLYVYPWDCALPNSVHYNHASNYMLHGCYDTRKTLTVWGYHVKTSVKSCMYNCTAI